MGGSPDFSLKGDGRTCAALGLSRAVVAMTFFDNLQTFANLPRPRFDQILEVEPRTRVAVCSVLDVIDRRQLRYVEDGTGAGYVDMGHAELSHEYGMGCCLVMDLTLLRYPKTRRRLDERFLEGSFSSGFQPRKESRPEVGIEFDGPTPGRPFSGEPKCSGWDFSHNVSKARPLVPYSTSLCMAFHLTVKNLRLYAMASRSKTSLETALSSSLGAACFQPEHSPHNIAKSSYDSRNRKGGNAYQSLLICRLIRSTRNCSHGSRHPIA